MKAKELMINDWVYCQYLDENVKVVALPKKGNEQRIVVIGTDEIEKVFRDNYIQPIPLTAEILKNNGFLEKVLDDIQDLYSLEIGSYLITFFSELGCPHLIIEDFEDNSSYHNVIVLKDEVYNIHELQHALRLCGIEKEIII